MGSSDVEAICFKKICLNKMSGSPRLAFNLKDKELKINAGEQSATFAVPSGKWYMQWGPHIYLAPLAGSMRVLLLYHESVDPRVLPSIDIKYSRDWNPRKVISSISLCSVSGILDIDTEESELFAVAGNNDVIALVTRRYLREREEKAIEMIGQQITRRRDDILYGLELKKKYKDNSLHDLTSHEVSKLFASQEWDKVKLSKKKRLFFSRGADGSFVLNISHDKGGVESISFVEGFALPRTHLLAALSTLDAKELIIQIPDIREAYYGILAEMETE